MRSFEVRCCTIELAILFVCQCIRMIFTFNGSSYPAFCVFCGEARKGQKQVNKYVLIAVLILLLCLPIRTTVNNTATITLSDMWDLESCFGVCVCVCACVCVVVCFG